jgi:putative ABC transport system permease protein
MTLSARAALSSFAEAVDFLRGRATHSLERPAGPMDETLLVRLMHDPAVTSFSPVIDRKLRLTNGELVHFLGIDPFLDRSVRPEIVRSRLNGNEGDDLLSFLLVERSVLIDARLADLLDVSPDG